MKTICLILISFCFSQIIFGQGTNQNFPFSNYKEFDLERGYEPGSIISIKKKRIESPIIRKERLNNVVVDKNILQYSDTVQIPSTKLNRLKIFKTDLKVKVKYQNITPEIKSNLNSVKQVELVVKKGGSYMFQSGSIALTDIIYALPEEDLEKIAFELKNKRKIYMITEVIRYDSASLFFKWGVDISADLKAEIINVIDIGTNNEWVDNGTLQVKYANGQLVGYKAIKIKRKYLKLIQERIIYRKRNGPDVAFYIDIDGDGYGDINSKMKLFTVNNVPNNFAITNNDCYDLNSDVYPNQTLYFETHRGDGSFDYNCDGKQEKMLTSIGECDAACSSAEPEGWTFVPDCGNDGQWLDDCDFKPFRGGCNQEYSSRIQKCR